MVNMKNNKHIGAIVCLSVTTLLVYFFRGSLLPFFTPSVHSFSHYWLVVALIPIYIAGVIFGMGMVSVYVGGFLQRWAKNVLLKSPVKL